MLNITAIKGSARKNSHSTDLLEKVLEGCRRKAEDCDLKIEIKTIRPFQMDINVCTSCFSCSKTATCIFSDDMDYWINDHGFDNSEIIILAAPIYFNGMPSHVKKMIDRCQPIYASKYDLNDPIIDRDKKRRALLISCAGAPQYKDQFTSARTVSNLFFKTLNAVKFGELIVPDTDNRKPSESPELMEKSLHLGRDLIDEFSAGEG